MKGRIELGSPRRFGMVQIGLPGNPMFDYGSPCVWNDEGGNIILHGTFGTNGGASITIKEGARLEIGTRTSFGANFRLVCAEDVCIGEQVLGSWDVTIMDTDFHEFRDLATGCIAPKNSAVRIEDGVFIASGVTILKGSEIAEGAVVGARSVVTGRCLTEHSLYVGAPARCKKEGIAFVK